MPQSKEKHVIHDQYLWALKGLIVEKKNTFFQAFQARDDDNDFHVPLSVWVQVCEEILGDFPWIHLVGDDASRSIVRIYTSLLRRIVFFN